MSDSLDLSKFESLKPKKVNSPKDSVRSEHSLQIINSRGLSKNIPSRNEKNHIDSDQSKHKRLEFLNLLKTNTTTQNTIGREKGNINLRQNFNAGSNKQLNSSNQFATRDNLKVGNQKTSKISEKSISKTNNPNDRFNFNSRSSALYTDTNNYHNQNYYSTTQDFEEMISDLHYEDHDENIYLDSVDEATDYLALLEDGQYDVDIENTSDYITMNSSDKIDFSSYDLFEDISSSETIYTQTVAEEFAYNISDDNNQSYTADQNIQDMSIDIASNDISQGDKIGNIDEQSDTEELVLSTQGAEEYDERTNHKIPNSSDSSEFLAFSESHSIITDEHNNSIFNNPVLDVKGQEFTDSESVNDDDENNQLNFENVSELNNGNTISFAGNEEYENEFAIANIANNNLNKNERHNRDSEFSANTRRVQDVFDETSENSAEQITKISTEEELNSQQDNQDNDFLKKHAKDSKDDLAQSSRSEQNTVDADNFSSNLRVEHFSSKNSSLQFVESNSHENAEQLRNNSTRPLDQITMKLQENLRSGNSKMMLSLTPENLGKVEIELSITENKIAKISVTAIKQDTLSMIIKDSTILEEAVKEIIKSDIEMEFSLKQENNDNGNESNQGNNSENSFSDSGENNEGNNDLTAVRLLEDTEKYEIISESNVDIRI